MPKLYFNVAGPCHPGEHYMLNPLRNIGGELMDLIDSRQYFVIHAARQSGKTTLLLELTNRINAEGKYHALYCSLEGVQAFTEPEKGIPEIVHKIESCIKNQGLPQGFAKDANYGNISGVLNDSLVNYCRSLDKPLVIFFDEADCLSNGTLITFLRQLRDGFVSRSIVSFVHSIALVGMRNIRDYKAKIRPDSETLGSSSPFNIVTESLNLGNFTKENVIELYSQHTQETGQVFEPQAMDCIYEQTQGQPWLVNAIARECVEKICKKDYAIPITQPIAEQAIQNLILARGTHFDSLMERLKEHRVRRIIEPLISGEDVIDRTSDDFLYTKDLGLVAESAGSKVISPSNPIYAEIMARSLSWNVQAGLMSKPEYEIPKYIKSGKIDMNYLLRDFQDFWRKNSEIFKDKFNLQVYEYAEAAPHLILQAFLQRVINGGGKIHREFAVGSGRADLCVEYEGHEYPIELKIFRGEFSISEGLEQLSKYVERCKCKEGWLVVFDRDAGKSWDKRIYMREEKAGKKKITIVGC
jgi:hypothetical protein